MPGKPRSKKEQEEWNKVDPLPNRMRWAEQQTQTKYRKGTKEAYAEQIQEFLKNPELIRKFFMTQVKRVKYRSNKTECWEWIALNRRGELALSSNPGKNPHAIPRFGLGKLSPLKTNNARRYIYMTTYPHSPLDWNAKIKMLPTCHRYCVNPEHMYPRPQKPTTPKQTTGKKTSKESIKGLRVKK